MNSNKKEKIGKLNLYTINNDYINYLRRFDEHIAYNKGQKRPYIGIVIIVDKHYYFAPLFSPKIQHKRYKDNLTFFRIKESKTKKELGIIRFSNMIPVPKEYIYPINIKEESYGYKRLISEQYNYINISQNKQKILEKANKLYSIVTKKNKSKMGKFYKALSCDYKKLEEKSLEYKL